MTGTCQPTHQSYIRLWQPCSPQVLPAAISLLNPNCWSKEAHHCVRNCANTHACSGDAVVAGSPEPSRPTVLGFTTLAGEQLLAFHKATDPLQPVALYEDVIEPGLEAGVLLYSSTAASAPSAQKLVLQMLMAQSDKKL